MFREHQVGGAPAPRAPLDLRPAPRWCVAGLIALGAATGIALLLWWLQPIASGHGYSLGVQTTGVLLAVWVAWCARPSLIGGRAALLVIAAVGLVASAVRATGLDPDAEVVRTYRSLFAALAHGRNPYRCECIVHVTPAGDRLGNFNYPPAEIWPYQAVQSVTGHWDIVVLTLTILALNLLAVAVIVLATPRGRRLRALAFLPLIALWELRTTIAATLVVTAVIVAVVLLDARAPRPWHRPVLWAAFGIGLLTKFAVIPLFATWWWWTTVRRARSGAGGARVVRAAAADGLVPLGVATVLCLPFGVMDVVRGTLLFNAQLDRRDELTTFYPNVLSGLGRWTGTERLYVPVAMGALAAAVLIAPRLRLLAAMLVTTTVFLIVCPTPEPQYLPMVLMLFLGALVERERGAVPAAHPRPGTDAAGAAGRRVRTAVLEQARGRHLPRMT